MEKKATAKSMSVFETLNAINVNEHVEKKNGLTYLSWAWAWQEVKKHYPEAFYTIYENANGWNYHTDGMTCWVKTGVTINGLEHIEYLPVMDNKNRSILTTSLSSFDVNKAIQRSLTKACARHGLGLYIYAGEDLPIDEQEKARAEQERMINTAISEVNECVSRPELTEVWNKYQSLKTNQDFIKAVTERGKNLAA